MERTTDLSRRAVLQGAMATAACAACAVAASGCGDTQDPALTSDVTIQLSDYPALASVGGVASIPRSVSGYGFDIFVRNEGEGVYRALSSYCSHEGCSVNVDGNGFRCPCHGATFSADGERTGGPAPRGLIQFSTEVSGDTLTILAEG